MIDSDALGELIAELVGEHVELALAPLNQANADLTSENANLARRVDELQAKLHALGPDVPITDEVISAIAIKAAEQIMVPPAPELDPATVVPLVIASAAFDERLAAAKNGKPGIGVAGALKDAKGHLILTLSDGQLVDIGKVDGNHGKNGETFTLDDFDITPIDERTIKMAFEKGGQRHSFELEFPVPVYRGVWREGETYSRGDMVTWAGSTWHCEEKNIAKPGEVAGNWTLAVKAGRPGRDKT